MSAEEVQLMNGCDAKDVQIESLYTKYLFDVTKEHKDPEPILTVNDIHLFTLGNFSCVTGQAKSRKSFLITAITGAFLNDTDGYLGFEPTNSTGTVLYCDTEQSEGHVNKVVKRIYRIAGLEAGTPTDRVQILALREADPATRKDVIEYAIKRLKPTLVVIDGVSDLFVNGVNDEREATEIVGYLMRITTEFNCHILTALHTNPGSSKVRGHAGSEVTRKAETVLQVSKDGDTSLVESMYSRGKDIDKFAFFISGEGLPMLTEIQDKKPAKTRLVSGFSKILPLQGSLSYSDLIQKVIAEFSVKIDMAKKKIKQALDSNIIEQNKIGYYHLKQSETTNSNLPF